MYLSRLFLNQKNRQANNDLRSPYGLHQSIRWAFPNAGEPHGPLPEGERLLWRVDELQDAPPERRQVVLLQSQALPDWEQFDARHPGYLRQVEFRQHDHDLARLQTGDEALFRLRANVTVNRWRDGQNREEDKHTKREALRGACEQVEWLDRQGERGGFSLTGTDITQSGNVRLYKRGGGSPVTLFAVTFEGLLRVEDPGALMATVQAGIGKGKALGFGLLSLRSSRLRTG